MMKLLTKFLASSSIASHDISAWIFPGCQINENRLWVLSNLLIPLVFDMQIERAIIDALHQRHQPLPLHLQRKESRCSSSDLQVYLLRYSLRLQNCPFERSFQRKSRRIFLATVDRETVSYNILC